MVGQSELAYRLLCRRHGADLCVTPMINAKSFVSGTRYQHDVALDLEEARRKPSLDRPLLVQFCGDNAKTLLRAAEMVQDSCDGIDLNLGCPQGIAKRGHYGAFLLEERDLVTSIVEHLSSRLRVPVTCKIRLINNHDVSPTLELCRALVKAGISLLTVHGRTREMKGHFVGSCDWEAIRAVRRAVGDRVPVLANGGVETTEDIAKCLAATHAHGVMISEASLANPAVFAEDGMNRPRGKLELANEYLDVVRRHAMAATHLADIKAHVLKMLFEILQQPANEGFRDLVVTATTFRDLDSAVKSLRACFQLKSLPSSDSSWYRRHRLKLQRRKDEAASHLGAPSVNRFDILANDDEDCRLGLGSLFEESPGG